MVEAVHTKDALRRLMKERRAEAQRVQPDAALNLRDLFMTHIKLPPHAVVAGYVAHDHEIDPAPLLEALRERGHPIALPVVIGKGQPLIFRLYDAGAALMKNSYGIAEPMPDAMIVRPDVVLVPLLAFDRQRNRLGYGGGFYDRTLKLLKQEGACRAIGLAYAAQEISAVPTVSHDMKLDAIVSNTGIY